MGSLIGVTFAAEQTAEGFLTDAELLMLVDGKASGNGEIIWKDRLFITNAVWLKYAGSLAMFQNVCNELNTYENNWTKCIF